MQGNKRVYPREAFPGKWLSYLLLFLSAVVLLSGLVWGGGGEDVDIQLAQTATPIPTDEVFDETVESREIALPSSTWYALQLGAFENEKAADELARQFMQRGAAGYVWQDGRYRTLAAVYPTREDAQNVRRQLSEQHTIDSYLYQIDLPALTLRIHGMKGQPDILEAGFIHANDLVAQLQAIGVMMDRQEKNGKEAVELISGLRAQMETVSLRLKQRFAAPRHNTVQGLIDCFEDYAEFSGTLEATDSAVVLATKIKNQTLRSLYILKNVYDELGNT